MQSAILLPSIIIKCVFLVLKNRKILSKWAKICKNLPPCTDIIGIAQFLEQLPSMSWITIYVRQPRFSSSIVIGRLFTNSQWCVFTRSCPMIWILSLNNVCYNKTEQMCLRFIVTDVNTWYGCYSTIADLVEMESVIQIIFGLLQKREDFCTNYKFNNKNNLLTWRDFKIKFLDHFSPSFLDQKW